MGLYAPGVLTSVAAKNLSPQLVIVYNRQVRTTSDRRAINRL